MFSYWTNNMLLPLSNGIQKMFTYAKSWQVTFLVYGITPDLMKTYESKTVGFIQNGGFEEIENKKFGFGINWWISIRLVAMTSFLGPFKLT